VHARLPLYAINLPPCLLPPPHDLQPSWPLCLCTMPACSLRGSIYACLHTCYLLQATSPLLLWKVTKWW